MSRITDRYASAVRSSNLRSKADTNMSDSDVIGAAGLAAAPEQPISVAFVPVKGDRPELVVHVGAEVAALQGRPVAEVASATTTNAVRFYGITP